MKAKKLAKLLMEHPEADTWGGAWNGHVNTYSVIDHVFLMTFGEVRNDFFGTPGRMDKRLFEGREDDDEILYIGSKFGRYPNPEVDLGVDDIDYPIKTLNGEGGDPDLVWHVNKFDLVGDGIYRKTNKEENWEITYDTKADILEIQNLKYQIRFSGKIIGIESIRDIIKACKIDFELWT